MPPPLAVRLLGGLWPDKTILHWLEPAEKADKKKRKRQRRREAPLGPNAMHRMRADAIPRREKRAAQRAMHRPEPLVERTQPVYHGASRRSCTPTP